jgi:hypothetical protein
VNRYSKELIEKVAAGIYESRSTVDPDFVPSKWPPRHPEDAQAMRDYAAGAIAALKIWTITECDAGNGYQRCIMTPCHNPQRRRYITDWDV